MPRYPRHPHQPRDDGIVIVLTKAKVHCGRIRPFLRGTVADVQAAADRIHLLAASTVHGLATCSLVAAGNLETQMPRFPERLRPSPAGENSGREILDAPAPSVLLPPCGQGPSCVRQLSGRMPGLTVPRATTVVSALWPGRHLIADWRALPRASPTLLQSGLPASFVGKSPFQVFCPVSGLTIVHPDPVDEFAQRAENLQETRL